MSKKIDILSFEEKVSKILIDKKYLSKAEAADFIERSHKQKRRFGTLLLENNIISRRDLYALILSLMKSKDLPTVLVEEKFISFEELTRVFLMKKGDLRRLGYYLVSSKILSENNFSVALAKVFNLQYISPENLTISNNMPEELTPEFFTKFLTVVTKYSVENHEIEFAICDPSAVGDILNSRFAENYKIEFVLTTFSGIYKKLSELFPRTIKNIKFETFSDVYASEIKFESDYDNAIRYPSGFPKKILEVIEDNENEKIRPLFEILYNAERFGANEILIESHGENKIKVFLKSKNSYFDINHKININNFEYIINKIKHLSKLCYNEERIFQTGSFTVEISGLKLFVKSFILPTLFGENAILKMMPLNKFPDKFDNFFKFQKVLGACFKNAFDSKNGLFLFGGIDEMKQLSFYYGILNEIARQKKNKKIISIEKDIIKPVKHVAQIEYIETTTTVRDKSIADSYDGAVKSSSDIIFSSIINHYDNLGNIEKLISDNTFSFFCSNDDSVDSIFKNIIRNKNAGLIIDSIKYVAAFRNMNLICPACRTENFDESVKNGFKVYYGAGCSKCGQSGVKDQPFIFEFIEVTEKQRKILKSALKDPEKLKKIEYEKFEVIMNEYYRDGKILKK